MSESAPPPASEQAPAPEAPKDLRERVIDVLRGVFDPEIPVNIYELGLVYGVEVDEERGHVHVRMTLTTPACPVAGSLPGEVEQKIRAVDGVTECAVDLVWDPPWTMEKLSAEAKLQLGIL